MTKKSAVFALLLGAIIFSSCGTGKKLSASEAQVSDLKTKNSQLVNENTQLVNENTQLKSNVSDLTAQNKTTNDQFNSYKTNCEAQAEQLKRIQAALNEFAANVQELQDKVEAAEEKFKDKGMHIYSKDGVVFVNMEDHLMYKSGSSKLNPDGKDALSNLASVLNEMPKLKVIVVGNTDTVHMKGVADNWSLSTERANGVVRVLIKDYQIDPTRLTAAGKGKFDPVADNSTAEGRANNRRTEIILNPDWAKLWQEIQKQ
jgi:chemotaxis protein MotB